MKYQAVSNLFQVTVAALAGSIVLFGVRLYEAVYLSTYLYADFHAFEHIFENYFVDLKAILLSTLVLIPFLFTRWISIATQVLLSNVIGLHIVLTAYFLTNFDLLGAEIFLFTGEELWHTMQIELAGGKWLGLLFMVLVLIGFALALRWLWPRVEQLSAKVKMIFLLGYAVFIIAILVDLPYYMPRVKHFSNYQTYVLSNNKPSFFVVSSLRSSSTASGNQNIAQALQLLVEAKAIRPFTDAHYPLRHAQEYPNVLGPYFSTDTVRPNIVLLMVESLSRSFSGHNAHLGSFTPFLDSLSAVSLYWDHFFSNAERTYGVLPNVLSSAPGFRSFMASTPYVPHRSLLEELKSNGYYNAFHYGGWEDFNSMRDFLSYHGIDDIFSAGSFDTTRFGMSAHREGDFHWGYDDGALLQQYALRQEQFPSPYLSVLLTLSMHSPYDVNKNYGINEARKHLGALTSSQEALLEAHPKKITSIAFADEMLSQFFAQYRQRNNFKHTIFVILGDHNIHSLPERNPLDAFHVPLIIYSPMLTQAATFKGVSTHRDILPSLLSLLQHNYGLKMAPSCHWLGNGLSVSSHFEHQIVTPMVVHSGKYINFMLRDYLVFQGEVYRMTEALEMELVEDDKRKQEVLKVYEAYCQMETYVFDHRKLF